MRLIRNSEFGGERPLYAERGLRLENVVVHAGESALKETADIEVDGCRFEGKYPLWCCRNFSVKDSLFTEGARAALWYSSGLEMQDCLIDAPKMFREFRGARLSCVRFTHAAETFWRCSDIELSDVQADGADYIFMHCNGVKVRNFHLNGNYSFQWAKDVEIRDSVLNTKDAFWETENVRVYDSEINGEYLGWHSRGLHLVRCHITGTQPLCYAEDLVLEDCTFGPDADLAFEYSSLRATVRGAITSVKNPRTGTIRADNIGEIILDKNIKAPGDCRIESLK